MQLWKKNFLVSYLLFLVVICSGLLLLDGYISRDETEQWIEHARNNESSLFYLAAGLKDEEFSRMSMNLESIAGKYAEAGILIRVRINGYCVTDYTPEGLEAKKAVEIRKIQGKDYLIIWEEQTRDNDLIEVDYIENLEELYGQQTRRMWIFCGTALGFALVVGLFLYYTMRRINRPVNQIAHELRTPLTGIRGYAEYIMMGNLPEEDRFYAAQQIVESAKNLQDIMEKLLIMGNVREGSIQTKRIRLEKILCGLKERYPNIETDSEIQFLTGDEALVTCLLENLTANAVSAGQQVRVKIDGNGIRVWNDGETLDVKTVRDLNKGKEIVENRIGKHGYGIQVCREIARAHGWKLRYYSSESEGTTAVCMFGTALF